MTKRRSAALAVLALAAAAVFVLPAGSASAASATTSNACANSVTANFSQIEVTTSGDDGLTTVAPGGATTTDNLMQSAAIPGDIFVAGYNLGLLQQGENNIPANVRSTIEATNTVQGQQLTNTVGGTPPDGSVVVTTTITDPDGTPGTGDETATDASFSVTYNDMNWTAGASGTIDYRQQSIATAPPTAANNTLLINALVGGVFNVQFRCAPGTVTGPDPGVITLIDPAGSFDTTQIVAPSLISISDATATEGGTETFTVTLDNPQPAPVTVQFATADGSAVAPGDYTSATGTVTFAPGDVSEDVVVQTVDDALVEGTETFDVNLSNPTGNASIADGLGVGTINDNDVANQAPTANAGADQTVASGATVQLDGTGSSDPDGDALTFAWTQTSGPAVTLSDPTSATPTFTAPTGPATLTFDLEVCDPEPLCDTDSVTINVNAPAASTISIGDASATEGGALTFNVSLSAPQTAPVTVQFATADGTAMAPGDYTAASGTVTFAPGDVSEDVVVQSIDDALVEGTETFDVNLSNPTGNASIADGLGVGTINDNDVANQAPTANAGPDQTVASGATVQLDGSGSTDPEGQALTFMWTQTSGPAVTLSDPTSATPTFTAPTGPATLTFDLEVCDPEPLCDTDSVTITVQAAPMADASGEVIVNGPVSSTKTSKSFVLLVRNVGTTPITINETNITEESVSVNGTPTGSVAVSPFTKTLSPGAKTRVKLSWSYPAGSLATGDAVVFHACVSVTGDIDMTNDCDDQAATAK
jgi:hypothetical protein